MRSINLKLLEKARGERSADTVLKNAEIVDVFNEELIKGDLAISDGKIIGIGDYEGEEEIDLTGKVLAPAFIDGHLHLESAMVQVEEFAREIISRGITTIVADPHEIANVAGLDGIEYMLEKGLDLPWNFNLMLPSCVPATSFETSGAELKAEDLKTMIDKSGIFGLGEVMDYIGVVNGEKGVWDKLELFHDKFIDGHAPGLSGKELNTYLLGGIKADHECTTAEEALEKIRKGMYVMIREGSVTRDLKQLLPAVNEKNFNRFLFATDDRHPGDIIKEGHVDFMIKKAVREGISPIKAIKLATINSASVLGFEDLGALAPGYKADIVVLDSLKNLNVKKVYKDGKKVAEDGDYLPQVAEDKRKNENEKIYSSVNIGSISFDDFELPQGKKYRVMELVDDQIVTRKTTVSFSEPPVTNHKLREKEINKLAVVERHHKTGNVGLGLLKGLGLKDGAIATSVGHDSHNIIVVGLKKEDMMAAVKEVERLNGGIVITKDGKVVDRLALPIAGLMSDKPLEEVADILGRLRKEVAELGSTNDEPFMTISFMALPVIPRLKVTDKGLFSAEELSFVPLVVE